MNRGLSFGLSLVQEEGRGGTVPMPQDRGRLHLASPRRTDLRPHGSWHSRGYLRSRAVPFEPVRNRV
jgi:hypothetical protein